MVVITHRHKRKVFDALQYRECDSMSTGHGLPTLGDIGIRLAENSEES